MIREEIIHYIYHNFPTTLRGINREGEHLIYIEDQPLNLFATLEKLPITTLNSIAEKFDEETVL